jgi:hypothetical protein
MATVALPAGFYLSRESSYQDDDGIRVDYVSGGEARVRILGDGYTNIECAFKHLTLAQKQTLSEFLRVNRANEITATIDGVNYIGRRVSPRKTTMSGAVFNINFTYYAREV